MSESSLFILQLQKPARRAMILTNLVGLDGRKLNSTLDRRMISKRPSKILFCYVVMPLIKAVIVY